MEENRHLCGMPRIEQTFFIHAPAEICFDLSRSIDLHSISLEKTGERAIAGVTSGLIGLDETVTWEAKHFGIRQQLTSKITTFRRPDFFSDEQVKGAFKWFRHQHVFRTEGNVTVLTDIFEFESPCGILGKLFNSLVLTRYMKNLLRERNEVVKQYAESGKWKEIPYLLPRD